MISAIAVVFTAAATLSWGGPREAPLVRRGGSPARGVLVNRTPGSRPFDPPDRTLPTVVFVHGFNPAPRVVHFEMAQQLAESLARRGGPRVNVLDWDWNAATFESLHPGVNSEAAVHQGHHLAHALWHAGVDPSRTHLIGHSAGGWWRPRLPGSSPGGWDDPPLSSRCSIRPPITMESFSNGSRPARSARWSRITGFPARVLMVESRPRPAFGITGSSVPLRTPAWSGLSVRIISSSSDGISAPSRTRIATRASTQACSLPRP